MNNKPVLLCEQLCKTVRNGRQIQTLLHDVSFSLQAASGAIITGASGSGKSTLLHLLGGLDLPSSGRICIQGQWLDTLSEPKRAKLRSVDIGFIYQFHHLLDSFTALENVAMPLLLRGISKKIAYQRAQTLLEQVELAPRTHHRPAMLSGGERQRVAFARALVHEPALILADEPTGSLDSKNAARCFHLLEQLVAQHRVACLLVTHDPLLAQAWPQRYVMAAGRLTPV